MGNNIEKIETAEGLVSIEITEIEKKLRILQKEGSTRVDIALIPKENIKQFMEALHKVVYADQLQPKYALKYIGNIDYDIKTETLKGINCSPVVKSNNNISEFHLVFNNLEDLLLGLSRLREKTNEAYYEIKTVY